MVKIFILLFLILNTYSLAFAGKAIVTVLEAPLFSAPDIDANVLQYVKKGGEIYLHPQEILPEIDMPEIPNRIKNSDEFKSNDPLIGDKYVYLPNKNSQFYKTITRSGRIAYVFKTHVIIAYDDHREITQKEITIENTDYRLEEPLSPSYPFKSIKGKYKGQVVFGVNIPNFQAYNYTERVEKTDYSYGKEMTFTGLKAANLSEEKRLFFGASAGFNRSELNFETATQNALQTNIRFFIGPHLAYDFYRSKKYIFSTYTSLQLVFYDSMFIEIGKETRQYKAGLSIEPNMGFNFQAKKAVYIWDSIIGLNAKAISPKEYSATSAGELPEIWANQSGSDLMNQKARMELSLYLGLQSFY